MADFSLLMLIFTFAIPILMVILTWVSKKAQHAKIGLAGVVLVILGVGGLALGGEVDLDPGWVFMEEPITFSITYTAIWLFLGTVLPLAGIIWQGRRRADPAMTPYQWMIVHLSLSFGLVAFFSGQFMIRYIALDIVGLLAALTVLSTFSATAGTRAFILMFQILRLGDLSLLASILLLNHLTGTLEISPMIAGAVDLPPNMRMWILLGFLLAILIKAAIWPFGLWLKRARQHAPTISFWTSGLLLPALGYYLLYRITPILQSGGIFQNLVLSTALALALLPILFTALEVVKFDRLTQVGGIMGCFLLAATVPPGVQFLTYYMLGLIAHRFSLLLAEETETRLVNILSALFPLLLNGLFIIPNLNIFPTAFLFLWIGITLLVVIWELALQRKPVLFEVKTIEPNGGLLGDEFFGRFLVKTADWLYRILEGAVLTHGVIRMSEFFQQVADWVYNHVELGMEYLWIWLGRKLVQISEGTLRKVETETSKSSGDLMKEALHSLEVYEQNTRRKTLRLDLAWIPLFLAVILIMLFVL